MNHCDRCAPTPSRHAAVGLLDLFCQHDCRWVPVPHGQLFPVAGYGMHFANGHLYAEGAGSALIETCRPASRFALAVQLEVPEPTAAFTPIVQFGDDWKDSNLCLGQLGRELRFRWKTDAPDAFGSEVHELNLGALASGLHSLSFRYSPGQLIVQVDGRTNRISGVTGDLDNWTHSRVFLGSPKSDRRWPGTLYHVAIGDRVPTYPLIIRESVPTRSAEPEPTPASPSDADDFPPPPSF